MKDVAARLRFPPPPSGSDTVVIPAVFTSRDGVRRATGTPNDSYTARAYVTLEAARPRLDPIVAARVYGGRLAQPKGATDELRTALREFPRQALHAARLQLEHPVTGRPLEAQAPLPGDMLGLLAVLAADLATTRA